MKKTKKLKAQERAAMHMVLEAIAAENRGNQTRLQKMISFIVGLQIGDGGTGPSDLDIVTWARMALAIAASSEPLKPPLCSGCSDFSVIPDLKKCARCL